ncbi:hypothetical protein [Paraburkholderia caffeinitolerans]|uniref:hypothetical protein n=1 Tax=Paraburkholderia caffeinitolerans TaxID=1723730 RepID=UPI0015820168|nr:hypothetical protein [Paraburkholderia caffeinitolerans]
MTKSTDSLPREYAVDPGAHRNSPQPLQVALRLWGFDEREVRSWIDDLPSLDGTLNWSIARERAADGAAVVVHVVKPSPRAQDAFCWNCVGANRAMVCALEGTRPEIVLFAGDAAQLPRRRAGVWSVAGDMPAYAALQALAYMIGASAGKGANGQFGMRRDLLAVIAQRLDA